MLDRFGFVLLFELGLNKRTRNDFPHAYRILIVMNLEAWKRLNWDQFNKKTKHRISGTWALMLLDVRGLEPRSHIKRVL